MSVSLKKSKIDLVIPLLVQHGYLQYAKECWSGVGVSVVLRNSKISTDLIPGSAEAASWLLQHLARWCKCNAALDCYYGTVGPTEWKVEVGIDYSTWGKAIGRTFGEAVFRAYYNMLTIERPPHSCQMTDEEMEKFL